MMKPKLSPPCSGWVSDLPEPTCIPTVPPTLGGNSPNHLNDNYLELSRHAFLARGLLLWIGVAALLWIIVIGKPVSFFYGTDKLPIFLILIGLISNLIGLWLILIAIKSDVAPPRDLPLRFNRPRQRIYAYNFKYRWWNPFERWRVVPVAYDWSQVRAERWKKRGATAQGALIIKWGVVLSIVEPGTNQVIDRFPLSTMGADEFAWAYICTYMQQGPSALPPPGPAPEHNDVPWYNLALRLAPKVKWPADMDLESRTAP